MLLFLSFLSLVLSADPCLSGENQPNYGGSCWNKWGTVDDIVLWAEENCGGNTCPPGADLTGMIYISQKIAYTFFLYLLLNCKFP